MNRRSFHATQLYRFYDHLIGVKFLLLAAMLTFFATGCSQKQPTADEVRERTADATAQIKTDTRAVVEGVREGLNRDKPLNLNTATEDQLTTLPGVTRVRADRVIAGRPYDDPHDVVTKHVLSEQEYKRIQDRITTK